MEKSKTSFINKLNQEALVTLVIASIAVLVTIAAFRQHTIDFEETVQRDMKRIELRITNVEERERSDTLILIRVDTRVMALQKDMASLRRQVATILARLPSNND